MSAVIWCGIVAVWIFVLIPTWVRRGDIHWHRGQTVAAAGPAENAEGGSGRKLHLPGQRLGRSRADQTVEVETMDQQVAEPLMSERAAPAAPRVRVAAAPSSGRLGGAVRSSFGTGPKGSGRKKPPIRVRRARRLVGLTALALMTLIIAIVAGGLFIVVNVLADIALVLYVRHLRGIARDRQAKALREKRARAARQAWDRASAQERASQLDGWRAPANEPATQAFDQTDAPSHVDLTELEKPDVIDLTDAPTEELATAQAS